MAPIPSLQQSPRVSLNSFDYTTFTIHLYYACLVLLYRWRLIVCSYFNLINNTTISLSGVATNFFSKCKWEWNLTRRFQMHFSMVLFQALAIPVSYLVSTGLLQWCVFVLVLTLSFRSGLRLDSFLQSKKINLKQPLCILSKIHKNFTIDT